MGLPFVFPPHSNCRTSVDLLARRHGGGGRTTAAGIDNLPPEQMADLLRDLR